MDQLSTIAAYRGAQARKDGLRRLAWSGLNWGFRVARLGLAGRWGLRAALALLTVLPWAAIQTAWAPTATAIGSGLHVDFYNYTPNVYDPVAGTSPEDPPLRTISGLSTCDTATVSNGASAHSAANSYVASSTRFNEPVRSSQLATWRMTRPTPQKIRIGTANVASREKRASR